jgi:photosystem II stability/assembly factor-like uncharacterized protein
MVLRVINVLNLVLFMKILATCLLCFIILGVSDSSAQWKPTTGPSLGHVNSFFNRNDTIYAAAGDYNIGSVLRSVDSGASWQWMSYRFPTKTTATAVLHDGVVIFAGTHNGLFQTSDNGGHWSASMKVGPVHALTLHKGAVFCAFDNDMKFTSDHGVTWTSAVSTDLLNVSAIDVIFSDSNYLYIGTNGQGVFRSSDMGKSWKPVAQNIPAADAYIGSIARADSVLIISTVRSVFRSLDHGNTWQQVSTGLPDGNGIGSMIYTGDHVIAGVQSYGIYLSSDLGASWQKSDSGLEENTPSALILLQKSKIIITSTLGIYRSFDGAKTWHKSDDGFTNTSINSLLAVSSGILAGNLDGDRGQVWKTTDRGDHWHTSSTGTSTFGVNHFALIDGGVLVGMDGDGLYKSTNEGVTWDSTFGLPYDMYMAAIATHGQIAICSNKGFAQQIYRSEDAGKHWVLSNSGIGPQGISSILADGDTFFAGMIINGFYKSIDSGKTWAAAPSPPGSLPTLIGKCNNILFASDGYQTLYRSTDHGASWISANIGLDGRKTHCIAQAGKTIYLGTDVGVYYSLDSASSWQKDSSDINNFPVLSFALLNGILYAGTDGVGVWSLQVSSGEGVERESIAAPEMTITPNPSMGKTKIEYTLSKDLSEVTIDIFDILGRKIEAISHGTEEAGSNTHEFDSNKLPGGSYLVRITIDGISAVRSLEVVR